MAEPKVAWHYIAVNRKQAPPRVWDRPYSELIALAERCESGCRKHVEMGPMSSSRPVVYSRREDRPVVVLDDYADLAFYYKADRSWPDDKALLFQQVYSEKA